MGWDMRERERERDGSIDNCVLRFGKRERDLLHVCANMAMMMMMMDIHTCISVYVHTYTYIHMVDTRYIYICMYVCTYTY